MGEISDVGLASSQAGMETVDANNKAAMLVISRLEQRLEEASAEKESLGREEERLHVEVAHLRREILLYKQGILDARGRIAQRGTHFRGLYEREGNRAVVYASGVDAELRQISAFLKQVEDGRWPERGSDG